MGRIVAITRFEIHDGNGIRTTLFLKGCPLACHWCHNPECLSVKPQLAFLPQKCLHCGECTRVCPSQQDDGQSHLIDRDTCVPCSRCEEVCLSDALKLYGREVTASDILPSLLEDRPFFEQSGGGVTISGGEPLMQVDFTAELLSLLKAENIHTSVDTCGFASREALDKVLPYTDMFLYDIKGWNEERHRRLTGQSNRIILDNLRYLASCNKAIEIRIPFIPGGNDMEISFISSFLAETVPASVIKLLPYHDFARSKYESLRMANPGNNIPKPTETQITAALAVLRAAGLNAVDGRQ